MKSLSFSLSSYNLLVLFIFSFFLQKYYLPIGFSLKPFIVISFILLIVSFLKLKFLLSPFDIALYLSYFFFSFRGLFSFYPEMSLRLTLGMIIAFITYNVLKGILLRHDIPNIERAILTSYIAFLFLSLLLYAIGVSSHYGSYIRAASYGVLYERNMFRLIGTTTDPNFFVIFSTLPFFILFKRRNESIYFTALFVISLISILLTISRGGILATSVGLFLYITMNGFIQSKTRNTRTNSRISNPKIIIYSLSIAVILFILHRYNLTEVFQAVIQNRVDNIESGSGRSDIWSNGIDLFYQNPLFGIGLFNFLDYNTFFYNSVHYMHNTYLEILVENGVVGFVLYSIFLLQVIYLSLKVSRNNDQHDYIFYCLISLLIQMLFLSAIVNEAIFFYLAYLAILNHKLEFRYKNTKLGA